MKRFLPVLFLLAAATPLLAGDEGGDGAYIPSYRELLREGYVSHDRDLTDGYYQRLNYNFHAAVVPTQAYYGRGFTVYYGYAMEAMLPGQENVTYAFGHPIAYFRKLLPGNVDASNINDVAVEVRNTSYYQPGDYVAQQRRFRFNAVTTVQPVPTATGATAAAPANGSNPLPPIGEKPSH